MDSDNNNPSLQLNTKKFDMKAKIAELRKKQMSKSVFENNNNLNINNIVTEPRLSEGRVNMKQRIEEMKYKLDQSRSSKSPENNITNDDDKREIKLSSNSESTKNAPARRGGLFKDIITKNDSYQNKLYENENNKDIDINNKNNNDYKSENKTSKIDPQNSKSDDSYNSMNAYTAKPDIYNENIMSELYYDAKNVKSTEENKTEDLRKNSLLDITKINDFKDLAVKKDKNYYMNRNKGHSKNNSYRSDNSSQKSDRNEMEFHINMQDVLEDSNESTLNLGNKVKEMKSNKNSIQNSKQFSNQDNLKDSKESTLNLGNKVKEMQSNNNSIQNSQQLSKDFLLNKSDEVKSVSKIIKDNFIAENNNNVKSKEIQDYNKDQPINDNINFLKNKIIKKEESQENRLDKSPKNKSKNRDILKNISNNISKESKSHIPESSKNKNKEKEVPKITSESKSPMKKRTNEQPVSSNKKSTKTLNLLNSSTLTPKKDNNKSTNRSPDSNVIDRFLKVYERSQATVQMKNRKVQQIMSDKKRKEQEEYERIQDEKNQLKKQIKQTSNYKSEYGDFCLNSKWSKRKELYEQEKQEKIPFHPSPLKKTRSRMNVNDPSVFDRLYDDFKNHFQSPGEVSLVDLMKMVKSSDSKEIDDKFKEKLNPTKKYFGKAIQDNLVDKYKDSHTENVDKMKNLFDQVADMINYGSDEGNDAVKESKYKSKEKMTLDVSRDLSTIRAEKDSNDNSLTDIYKDMKNLNNLTSKKWKIMKNNNV